MLVPDSQSISQDGQMKARRHEYRQGIDARVRPLLLCSVEIGSPWKQGEF
jgi:hypothetical protein